MKDDIVGMRLETLDLKLDYYRTSPICNDIRLCLTEGTCVDGNSSSYCREGHRGALCNLCLPKHGKDIFKLCKSCGAMSVNVVLSVLTLAFLVVFFAVVLIWYRNRVKEGQNILWKRLKNGGKIIFSAAQIISSLPSVTPTTNLPENVKVAMSWMSWTNMNVFGFLGVERWFEDGFNYYFQASACFSQSLRSVRYLSLQELDTRRSARLSSLQHWQLRISRSLLLQL